MRRPLDRSVEAARNRFGVRIVKHWIEESRIVLLVEAPRREALSRAMQGFGIRFAKAVHRELDTRGPVLDERFHLVVLRNRPQVREALGRMLRRTNRRFREELDSLQGLYTTDNALEATDRGPPIVRFALLGLELAAMVATSRASMFNYATTRNAGAMIRQEERAARERKRRRSRNQDRRYKDRLQREMYERYRREMSGKKD
jgi:hypothetical protein